MSRTAYGSCNLTVEQLMERSGAEPKWTVNAAGRYLANCTPEDRAQALARADDHFASDLAARSAERRRPRSLVGCEPGAIITLRVVQHNQHDNSMLISVNGSASDAKWVPIAGKPTKAGKPGKPITSIFAAARAWQPGTLGFLIVFIPGWLASDRGFTTCAEPQLSSDVTWTSADVAAWAELNKIMRRREADAASVKNKERFGRSAAVNPW